MNKMCRLQFERRKRGLSQEALGKELNYRGERIYWLEHPNRKPEEVNRRLRKIVEDYFGISLEMLLGPV